MNSAGKISITLELDGDKFSASAAKAGQRVGELRSRLEQLDRASQRAETSSSSLFRTFHNGVVTLGLLGHAFDTLSNILFALPASFLQASGEMERMTMLMEGLSKQTEELARRQEAISNRTFVINMSKSAPFEIKAISDSFVKLKSAGLDPADGSLQALIDSVAKFGGSSEQLKRASIAIQQMAGKGVVSMEELRQQLGEAVPNAIQAMAVGTGMSMAELTKKISTGTVEANDALRRMIAVLEYMNGGAAAKMMDTLPGQLERLKTEWMLFKTEVGDGAFADAAKNAIDKLIEGLANGDTRQFGREVGQSLADVTNAAVKLAEVMATLAPAIKLAAGAFVLWKVSSAVGDAMRSLGERAAATRGSILGLYDATQRLGRMRLNSVAGEQFQQQAAALANQKQVLEAGIAAQKAELESARASIMARMQAEQTASQQRIAMAIKEAEVKRGIEVAAAQQRIRDIQQQLSRVYFGTNNRVVGEIINGQLVAVTKQRAAELQRESKALRAEVNVLEAQTKSANVAMAAAASRAAAETKASFATLRREYDSVGRSFSGAIGPMQQRLVQVNQQIARHERQVVQAAAVSRTWAAATTAATIAGRGLSAVLGALGGPAGLAITAILGVVTYLAMMESAADRAAAATRAAMRVASGGIATQEELDKAKGQIGDKFKDVQAARASYLVTKERQDRSLALAEARMAKMKKDSEEYRKAKLEFDKLRAEYQKEQNGLKAAWDKAETALKDARGTEKLISENLQKQRDQEAGFSLVREEVARIEAKKSKDQVEFNRLYAQKGDGDEKKRAQALQKFIEQSNAEQLQAYTTLRDGLAKRLESAKGNARETAKIQSAIEQVEEKMKPLQKTDAIDFSKPTTSLAGTKKPPKPKSLEKSAFEEEREKLIREAADAVAAGKSYEQAESALMTLDELKAKYFQRYKTLNDTTRYFQKDEKDAKLTEAQIAKLAEIKAGTEFGKMQERAIERIRDLGNQYGLEARQIDERTTEATGKIKLRSTKLEEAIAELKKIDLGSAQADFDKFAKQAEESAAKADFGEFMERARNQINGNADGLMTDSERQRQRLQRELESWQEALSIRLKIPGLSQEQADQMREAVNTISDQIKQMAEEAGNPFAKIRRDWEDTTDAMKKGVIDWTDRTIDSFIDMAKAGKFEFGKLTESILSDIAKIAMRKALSGFTDWAVQGLGNLFGGFLASAKGNAFIGGQPIKQFAKGGAFTNALVNTPTYFNMGLMGEAGPEAIMPLSRDGNGRLGVRVNGNAGSQAPQVTVNVINQTTNSMNAEKGNMRFDGRSYVMDVVLTEASKPGAFRDGLKSAMSS
ncbi:tape measure protein [Chitinibacter tainanensis]|uniref:tape measure protein n=1 Tax=Chitinibacter tainanensis TaxID=230667 RepID=UPI00041BF8D9|nr:tape measure protein [Chitinibacter tainanensis]